MNAKLMSRFMIAVFAFVVSSDAQVVTVCTPEYLKKVENERLAASIRVVDTATQQKQCYYQQLATYYQQIDKDNQQKAKDAQQIAKDAQQIDKDKELLTRESACFQREAACTVREKANEAAAQTQQIPEPNPWKSDGFGGWFKDQCGERWTSDGKNILVDGIPIEICMKLRGEACMIADGDYKAAKDEYKKAHTNHSGGADGTNPGGGGNLNGYLNPNNSN